MQAYCVWTWVCFSNALTSSLLPEPIGTPGNTHKLHLQNIWSRH